MKCRSELQRCPLGNRITKSRGSRSVTRRLKMDENVSNELEVPLCTTWLDQVELECSFKSAMRRKIRKNMINFV